MRVDRIATPALVSLSILLVWASAAGAGAVTVRFTEGVVRAFPALRSVDGNRLAHGELTQVTRGDRVQSRLVFRFKDGSLHDETVVFSQRAVFTLEQYHLVQKGPSFPEAIEASFDRATEQYRVRYRADGESPEEIFSGRVALPADVYNGMLFTLLKNLQPGQRETVQVLAFTPRPHLVKMLLAPAGEDDLSVGDQSFAVTRYTIKPQLGMLASLLVADLAPIHCWVLGGEAPAFVRFEGPLYFMGPVWRIELN